MRKKTLPINTPSATHRRVENLYGVLYNNAANKAEMEQRPLSAYEQDYAYMANPAQTAEEAVRFDQERRLNYANYGEREGILPPGIYMSTQFDVMVERGEDPYANAAINEHRDTLSYGKGLHRDVLPKLSHEPIKPDYSASLENVKDFKYGPEDGVTNSRGAALEQVALASMSDKDKDKDEVSLSGSFATGALGSLVASRQYQEGLGGPEIDGESPVSSDEVTPDGNLDDALAERFKRHPELRDQKLETTRNKALEAFNQPTVSQEQNESSMEC